MKKKVFKAFGVLAIIAILALNVSVVLDSNSTSVLKWDLVGKILAQKATTSGSSGENYSGCTAKPMKMINENGCGICKDTESGSCAVSDQCCDDKEPCCTPGCAD